MVAIECHSVEGQHLALKTRHSLRRTPLGAIAAAGSVALLVVEFQD